MPPAPEIRRAAVIGGGSWGTALAHLMAVSGADVRLWMRNPERIAEINDHHTNKRYLKDRPIHANVVATDDLAGVARFAELIVVAIPSAHFRQVAFDLGAHVQGDQILLSATKGFDPFHGAARPSPEHAAPPTPLGAGEDEDADDNVLVEPHGAHGPAAVDAFRLVRMSEVLREETCARKIGAISGPNLADEVMQDMPTATVIASPFDEVIEKAAELLGGPTLRVYGNHDLVGAELFGALKNIYAIASGVCTGMGLGANSLSMMLTRALAEMTRFAEALGAQTLTGLGLAGIGDLIATCSSPLSRNNTLGRKLAEGKTVADARAEMHKVAEGVNTTDAVCRYAARLGVDMPIARGVHRLLFEGDSPADVLAALMSRINRYEHSERPIDQPSLIDGSVLDSALSVVAHAREREGDRIVDLTRGADPAASNGAAG